MSLERQLSVLSSAPKYVDCDGVPEQPKRSTKFNLCHICGDQAYNINYGTLSCPSCKTFFRRRGSHPKAVRSCFFNRSCKINVNTRRNCADCRLAKCLLMGMNPGLIRKEASQNRKDLLMTNIDNNPISVFKMKPVVHLPTLDLLLHSDRPSLTNSEWTLLSNVIHAHDIFTATPQVRRTIDHLSILPSSLRSSYTRSNVFETTIFMYTSMHSFIMSLPDFRILTIHEQHSLCERNLHGIVPLCSILFFRTTGIIHNPICMETCAIVYGSEMMFQVKRIEKQLDFDATIVKLMLIILAFSSNCFLMDRKEHVPRDSFLHGTYRLFGSQNVYVELLWKYMIYRYGYDDSVRRFFRLVGICLDLMKYSGIISTINQAHRDLIDGILEQTKQSLTLDQNTQRPLWGRKT